MRRTACTGGSYGPGPFVFRNGRYHFKKYFTLSVGRSATDFQWRIQKILMGGDFKHKTSKIRMSSPKLRMIFRSNVFFAQNQVVSKKKKKKVFTKIETDFSAEIGNSNVFFAQIQVVSKKKKKKNGLHQN